MEVVFKQFQLYYRQHIQTIVLMKLEQRGLSKQRQSFKQQFYQNDAQNALGKYRLLVNDYHKREPFLTIGPNYLFFSISFVVINVLTIILLYKLGRIEEVRPFFLILTVALIFLDIVWLATALINPGISTSNIEQHGEFCQICQAHNDIEIVKKVGRYHCPQCDVCIDDQESHFKIVGGCIGKNNIIAFKLLLIAIFIWGLSMITIVPLSRNL